MPHAAKGRLTCPSAGDTINVALRHRCRQGEHLGAFGNSDLKDSQGRTSVRHAFLPRLALRGLAGISQLHEAALPDHPWSACSRPVRGCQRVTTVAAHQVTQSRSAEAPSTQLTQRSRCRVLRAERHGPQCGVLPAKRRAEQCRHCALLGLAASASCGAPVCCSKARQPLQAADSCVHAACQTLAAPQSSAAQGHEQPSSPLIRPVPTGIPLSACQRNPRLLVLPNSQAKRWLKLS